MEFPSSELSANFLEDFGQKVDLTRRIREVLLNYPEGTTILKELIQNADDAGATRVRFCLDRRVHGSEYLLSNSLSQWQGPALLAYNDAVFSEEDFSSISRIGGSGKHGQAWKTGRFGVGFNSVYHLTDLPSFVSGKYIVMFDPQGVYLPNISSANPGKRIEYVSSSAISLYKDQFFPYCAFGCDMKSPFAGTLFRFPLRNAEQAARSKLSRQAYSEDNICSMFDDLHDEAIFTLLFLKNILSIEIYTWDVGEPEPGKLYSCSVSSEDEKIVWHRQTLLRLSKLPLPTNNEMDAYLVDFLMEAFTEGKARKSVSTFYVVQTMASTSSDIGSFVATTCKDYDIHLLPWASVAACISDDSSENSFLRLGRAFCFLPLPVKTGLTVQVNGYFEVSSNRRGIWYGGDMDKSGKIRSMWNKLLLEDVVAPSFIKLLIGVQGLMGPSDAYYSLWPSGAFEEPWSVLVEQIYKNIINASVLYSKVGGGKWVSPVQAFLYGDELKNRKELIEAMLQLGIPIVHLPNPLFSMFLEHDYSFQHKVVTPDSVRHFLRNCNALVTLGRPYKLILLEYCVDDLIDADVGANLSGLRLLPLANGDFGFFYGTPVEVSYFFCNELEYILLEKVSERVIDRNIPKNMLSRLLAVAMSKEANLIVFDVQHFVQLLPSFVPADWKYKNKVFWDPQSCHNHPKSSWFVLFWQYLRVQCDNLSLFGDWPILPSVSGHLYRASTQLKLINPMELSTAMQEILMKLGCKLLHTNYGVQHPELSHYVADANYASVLEAISDAICSNGGMRQTFDGLTFEERDKLRGFLFESKWYLQENLQISTIRNCKRLPIYKVYGADSSQPSQFSDLENPKKFLPPSDVPRCLLGGEFIIISSSIEVDILLRYYGIERMQKTCFYKQHVFGRIMELPSEIRDRVMVSVLQDLPQLCVQDTSFRECLKTLAFVPTVSGVLRCPSALYDPRKQELYALLEDSNSFPCGAFEESHILDMLQGLGLKTSVSPETVIESARQVERLMRLDPEKAHSRGKMLLSYLEVNAMKWLQDQPNDNQGTMNRMIARAATTFRIHNLIPNLEKFWNDLRMICWCPVLVSPPFQSLPWPVVSSSVAPPKFVRLQTDMWLVSASMRILDGECSSTALSYNLGWLSPPGGSAIAAQLLELGKNNETVNDHVLRQELTLAMPKIYSILTSLIGSDEMDIVKAIIEGCRWIWVGDGFATSDEVVLDGPLNFAPYIRVIPVDLAAFKELFLEFGIREFLKPIDYANVLSHMAMGKCSSPLDTHEIRVVLSIVQNLSEAQFSEQSKIYLPDISNRLFPAGDLVYNDAPWLFGSDDFDSSFGDASSMVFNAKKKIKKLVHGNISNEVAEKLGASSLRRILLAESADSMNLSLSGSVEAFGQHEALTARLKHILEMYADGPGILFELVQNAEDAGASQVAFLLDKTQYGVSSVLSPEMADWQGPALYCFNDSIFSQQDLYAISRIGQESKLEKPFAIGRFGLGFNCVYHFTDIPTFVSGENIVMFDPHACNLPGISPSHPGLRIKFAGRKLLEQFPDQFSPFLHFGCDLQQSFPGTLFRFPLRSASVAMRSQIKKERYETEDVLSLFSSFSNTVSQALLFLHNVKVISIYVKEGPNCEMQLLHCVRRDIVSDPNVESSTFDPMFDLFNGSQHKGMDKDQLLTKLSKSIIKDLPHKVQKIVITEKNSSGGKSHCWITGECIGGLQTEYNTSVATDKSHNSIPWACVAAYIHSVKVGEESGIVSNMEDPRASDLFRISTDPFLNRTSFEGRAFCFLPLPIHTGLPVHTNAYFELSSNRRDIWFGNDMAGEGKKRSDWNIHLLEDIVAPAYSHLLENLASEIGPCELFFSFWPTTRQLKPWSFLVQKLYKFIVDCGLRILYTKARGGKWISTKQAVFPDFNFHKMQELVEALSDAGLPLVTLPEPVVQSFMEVCPCLHALTPTLLRTLLIRRKREFKDRTAIILTLEYCLSDFTMPIQPEHLYGLHLLPLADGSFAMFEKKGTSEKIYIAQGDEYGLLKDSLSYQLVDREIPEALYLKLCNVAEIGESNLSFLSCCLLEKVFLKLLPMEWQFAKKITWSPGQQGQPSLEWMRLLWNYLNLCCDDLLIFSKWPLLPVEDNYLLPLTENSHVIMGDVWSESMSSLLLKVGCLFLRHDLQIEHAQLEKFVQPPTATGILNALLSIAGEAEKIGQLFNGASEGELHELRSFILQSKWFVEEQMDETHIDVIRRLPMFEAYTSRKLVSMNRPSKWLKPNGVSDEFLNDDFVRTESERERIILATYLGISEPSKVEFYKIYVLNRMPELVTQQKALSAILHDVKLMIEEDITVKSALSMTPFVLAANGSWQAPSRLYDPRIPELRKMLHAEVFFPSDNFSDPETLDILVNLGLKQTLGLTGLLDCARSISMLHESANSEAVNYGRKLLKCLDTLASKLSIEKEEKKGVEPPSSMVLENNSVVNTDDLYFDSSIKDENHLEDSMEIAYLVDNLIDDQSEENFWSEMKAIAWCPVCADPPIEGLPWLKTDGQIAIPSTVRPKSEMWIVSSSMHVLDGECTSTYLQHKLGWMEVPSVDALSSQLILLSKSYGQFKLHMSVESDFDVALQEGIPKLYLKMSEYIGTDNFIKLKSALDGVAWVWIGDDFVHPNALAFDAPVKFSPYLYVVPSELSEFRELLLELGVKLSFNVSDYFHVLKRLQNDVKGVSLSTEQLGFVHCILEAIADCFVDKPLFEVSSSPLLIPDCSGTLMNAGDLVYNDAPWIEDNALDAKHFIHPSISNDLAERLGVKSLRCLSLVDEDMTKDFPCMDFARINELLTWYGGSDFLLFDLLELADCCKAKKLHLVFDKRNHPHRSLLQHNLGEFQGPALVAVLEGVSLSREEISSLQLLPPWGLRGETLNYGLGLLSCYFICDFLSILSGGYFYMFDPRGLALGSARSSHGPAAKVFSLSGTNLIERFRDQFNPMLIDKNMAWSPSDSTIIRIPLSSECLKDGLELGLKRVKQLIDRFWEHASRSLLFLKSVLQVSVATWEEGSAEPCEDYSVCVDSLSAMMRNPFSEKKWRKFQLSRFFSSSNAANKLHVIDVMLQQDGTKVLDRWLVSLSLGSGQTRNMALDRRYLAYKLTPVAGVAAHISRDCHPADTINRSAIMSPLPLSADTSLPVTVLGCFLVRHNSGRYLFKYQEKGATSETELDAGDVLIEAWNKELMSCVCDSYIELVLEMQKLIKEPSNSRIESSAGPVVALSLKAYGDQIYSFWPRSNKHAWTNQPGEESKGSCEVIKADSECLIEQVIRPFYSGLVDLPVWKLYNGNFVKAREGLFLSQPVNAMDGNFLPATVCGFVKEHYQVFSVPWELVTEIKASGISVQEIKPKMVRDLLKVSSTSISARSVDTYIDVLEYCLSDIQIVEASGSLEDDDLSNVDNDSNRMDRAQNDAGSGSTPISLPRVRSSTHSSASSSDALEMMTSLGKALFDFGRVVAEDIGRAGGPMVQRNTFANNNRNVDPKLLSIAAEVKALPCPTAKNHLAKLGVTELWLGNKEQQALMISLEAKFVHPKVYERTILVNIFTNSTIQSLLKLKSFSLHLLASNMKFLLNSNWVNHVMDTNMAPWFSWENKSSCGGAGGPSPEWLQLFWKGFSGSLEDLSLFSDWPLVPAFLGRPILCRVRDRHLLFVPPSTADLDLQNNDTNLGAMGSDLTGLSGNHTTTSESIKCYMSAFEIVRNRYPWLFSFLNQCNVPIFDTAFMDFAASSRCLPTPGQSLGKLIASKLVAAKNAGHFPELSSSMTFDRDELFTLFAHDFFHNSSKYVSEELDVLRSLPIYKTVVGSCSHLNNQEHCMISSNSFFKPYDERCLSYSPESVEYVLLRALGVVELHDREILVKFGLPGFEGKPQAEQEDILIYLYTNWNDLQENFSVIETLKETKFVRNNDEFSMDLCRPKDLFDPADATIVSIFSGQGTKFPGERFGMDGWLQILRKVGLRTSTEADVILECARRVEFLGNDCMKSLGDLDEFDVDLIDPQTDITTEIWALAGSLVEVVFSNFAVLYSTSFCNQLGKISFVPAELGLPSVYGKRGGKKVLTSYGKAILSKDWPLAWSCSPILTRQNVVPPEYSRGAFQLSSPPTFSTVLRHLQFIGKNGGEDILAHWPITSGMMTIDEASCEILKYLDKVWSSLSSSDIKELQRVAFLPAANGTRLVMASCLFVRLAINLSPFAFELPTIYLPYVRVLKELGIQDMLSISSAKDLLLDLHKTCGDQRLNPNELRAVMEILHFVCDGIENASKSAMFGWQSDAIVPTDGCQLVNGKSCVYIDSYGSQYVRLIDTSTLRFVHPDLAERICMVLGIKKLSDVVIEELNHEEHLQTLECIGSLSLTAIREKLLSRSLQGAIWNLVNSMASYSPPLNKLTLRSIENSLENVSKHLKFVKCLHTRFVLLPNSIDITLVKNNFLTPGCDAGLPHRTLYFIDQSRTCIYISEPPSYVSVLDIIAVVVSQALGCPFALPIGSLFLCPEGSETSIADIMKLCSGKREDEARSYNLLGKEILANDALQIQIHPLRPFYRGEIVAWRIQSGEKLKYGKIPEDVRPLAGQALYRFKVETNPGVTESLLSSQVFSFRGVLMRNETFSKSLPVIDNYAAIGNSSHAEVPESSRNGSTKTSQPRAELQYGQVSTAELVQAVDEMLSAAGISMGLEKKNLLQKTITLQEQLESSQAALLIEQEKSDVAIKEADTAKAAWMCRVCLSNELDMTLVPCGHVLCHRCASAVSKCPFCRVQVNRTLKIFRP